MIRATQGDMPVIPEPYAPGRRRRCGIPQERLLAHLAGMQERRLLRRVAAILLPPPRRVQRQRDGRLEGPRRADRGARAADGCVPRISHCYQRPTYAGLALLGLHDGPRPLQGGVRRDPRLDRRRHRDQERTTLYSSTEFKKIRLLYFTDEYRAWEREHAADV